MNVNPNQPNRTTDYPAYLRWLEIIETLERWGFTPADDPDDLSCWRYSNGHFIVRVWFPGRMELEVIPGGG